MKALIRGGEAIAAFLGLDEAALVEAILYEALPVFECGGELYAAPRQLARWQATDLADLPYEPCPQWYEHMQAVLAPLMASDAREAA